MTDIRSQLPETCPNCGHDPTGDDEEFHSGGGWILDTSVIGTARGPCYVQEMKCPTCREPVARTEEYDDDQREF